MRRRAIELLADEMTRTKPQGGRVPVDTGNLARSLLADTSAMPKIADGPSSGSNVGIITATLMADQPVWLGYTAAYARRMNSGFVGADSLGRVYSQDGHYFVEGAAQQWSEFVKKAATEIQQSVESRK
ncbi:MAG: hypothetical protein KAX63_02360 [Pseudomonas sp.]|nr:hypothetical protein [Pseudomonas sp.]